MAKGKLFEYAVIYHPKVKKDEEPQKSSLVTEVTRILADSDKEVGILAARSLPDTYLDKLEQVEIVIRPF